jgi:3-hydroxyisobutyrate dehydrogenase-like beta-hydroxyacid dehydrogenase
MSSAHAPRSQVVAVLGLGEAGGAFAGDLAHAGATVRGYDPADVPVPDGVDRTSSEVEAVTGADLVLSVNSASAAREALRAAVAAVTGGAVWADLNTASPGAKRALAGIAAEHRVSFADVAIMAPVPGRGLSVPMLACGDGAAGAAATLNRFGASVDLVAGQAGTAAERKLLRSVFFKGLAAAVVESLAAARAAGCEDWVRQNIVTELTAADASTLDRLVSGTHRHAVRRTAEMTAAADMLTELGVEPAVAAASRDLLARLAGTTAPRSAGEEG